MFSSGKFSGLCPISAASVGITAQCGAGGGGLSGCCIQGRGGQWGSVPERTTANNGVPSPSSGYLTGIGGSHSQSGL